VRFRWRAGMLIVDGMTVVGSVDEGASGHWFGYGSMDDWQDTPLGHFNDEDSAKAAVLAWAENNL
jgi:hypothetical protein